MLLVELSIMPVNLLLLLLSQLVFTRARNTSVAMQSVSVRNLIEQQGNGCEFNMGSPRKSLCTP